MLQPFCWPSRKLTLNPEGGHTPVTFTLAPVGMLGRNEYGNRHWTHRPATRRSAKIASPQPPRGYPGGPRQTVIRATSARNLAHCRGPTDVGAGRVLIWAGLPFGAGRVGDGSRAPSWECLRTCVREARACALAYWQWRAVRARCGRARARHPRRPHLRGSPHLGQGR
jgi:hypothetical protein